MSRGRSLAFACRQTLLFANKLLSTASKCQRLGVLNQIPSLRKSYTLSIQHYCTEFSTGSTDPITCSASSVEAHWEPGNAHRTKQDITERFYTDKLKEVLASFEERGWEAATEKALGEFSNELTPDIVANIVRLTETDMANSFFRWAGRQEGYRHSKHSYNMLFRNFAQAHNFESAIQILKEMKEQDFTINPKTFVTLVHHYGQAGLMSVVLETPDLMKSFGVVPDQRIYVALVNAFLGANDQDRASKLIQKILDEGIVLDVDSFNDLLSTCARGAEVDNAMKVLENMKTKGCTPNICTYNILIKWFCQARKLDAALKLFEALGENELVPNVGTYNLLIRAFCIENRLDEASNLFAEMTKADCCPDIATHNYLLSGYFKFGQIEKALLHLETLSGEGCEHSARFERMHVYFLCNANKVDEALQIFENTSKRGERMLPDACNIILHALGKAGRLDDALKILEKMLAVKCNPNLNAYNILIRCCCKMHKLDTASQLFNEAKGKGLKFSVDTFVTVLHAFSRASKFTEVDEICEDLLVCSPKFFGKKACAVLDALNIAQRLDGALEFCNYVMENNLQIHARQLNRLAYLLHRKGRSSEASSLNRDMVEKGCVVVEKNSSTKTVGSSNV